MAVSWLDEGLGVIVSTAGVTVLLLIFGEMIPKTFASRHPEWLAFRYQRPFCLVEWILRPISVLLHWIGIAIIKLSGAKAGARDLVSPELLQSVITAGQQAGTVEEEEATILRKVLGFGDRRVNEVMTPRNEVVWMNEETTLSTFLDIYVQLPHPRFPVYKESVDNVVGILHTQDVIKAMHNNEIQQDTPLLRLGQPAIFVPETKPLDDLFVEMRASGVQMALAVDEYGGVAGLVTMNQLLTAIIGRFGEEGEEGEEEYESLGEGAFQVDGGMQVSEANEANEGPQLKIPEGEYETVAGFVLGVLGHIPHEGETISYGPMKLQVTEMRGSRSRRCWLPSCSCLCTHLDMSRNTHEV